PRRRRHGLPEAVAVEDLAVLLGEHLLRDGPADDLVHFIRCRPNLLEEHGLAPLVISDWLILQIDMNRSGERVRDDERRRREVARLHERMDAALKVAVA